MNCFNVTTLTQGRNDVTCKNAYLGPHDPRFCYISFSEIGVLGVSNLALGLQSSWLSAAISSAFSQILRPDQRRKPAGRPNNHGQKYERPAAWGTTGLP